MPPSVAHEELGGEPLSPRGRRFLVMRVMESLRLRELVSDQSALAKAQAEVDKARKTGDPNASKQAGEQHAALTKSTVGQWTRADHALLAEVMELMGRPTTIGRGASSL